MDEIKGHLKSKFLLLSFAFEVWVFIEEDLEDESVALEVTYNFVLATME